MIRYFAIIVILIGCSSQSRLDIDSGNLIKPDAANTIKGVVQILTDTGGQGLSSCTATLVSATTLVTAAHCVHDDGQYADPTTGKVNVNLCIRSGANDGLCTREVFLPAQYTRKTADHMGYDVAVAVFPVGSFKTYHYLLTTTSISVSDLRSQRVTAVGYSKENVRTDPRLGSKQWGDLDLRSLNTLELDTFISRWGQSNQAVSVSSGDSGGPLFASCQLTGIASREGKIGGNPANEISYHTNLTHPLVQAFLKGVEGAVYCDASQAGSVACPRASAQLPVLEKRFEADGTEQFPCSSDAGGEVKLLPVKVSEQSFQLYVGSSSANIVICLNKTADQCSVSEREILKDDRLSTGRFVSKVKDPLNFGETLVIVDLDTKTSRKFSVSLTP